MRFAQLPVLTCLLVIVVAWPGPAQAEETPRWHTFRSANGLAGNIVQTIWEAPDGAIWFGTESGVSRYDGVGWTVYGEADGLADGNVWAVSGDAATVWCATSRGLSRLRAGRWERFGRAEGLPGEDVRAVLVAADGVVWAGTFGRGIARLRPGATRWEPLPLPEGLRREGVFVQAIWQAPDGVIWFATNGLGALRLRNGRIEQFSFRLGSRNTVWSVGAGPGEAIWLATLQGVARIDPDGRVAIPAELAQGIPLSTTETLAVAGDAYGDLWLATRSQGVLRRADAGWQRLTAADGLGRTYVQTILADRAGRVWFGTRGGGVTLFERRPLPPADLQVGIAAVALGDGQPVGLGETPLPAESNDLRFHFAAATPWLPPDEVRFRYSLERDGLALGPVLVARSDPETPIRAVSEPLIDLPPGAYLLRARAVTDHAEGPEQLLRFRIASAPPVFAPAAPALLAAGHPVETGLTLPQELFAANRSVELHFSATDDTTPPALIRYEYRLPPDPGWRAVTGDLARIELPPGDWHLEARAIDAEGNPSAVTTLRVVVPTPLWTTLLVALLVVLVPSAASGVAGALFYRRWTRRQALLRAIRGYQIPYDVGPLISLPDRYIGREHVIDTIVGKIDRSSFYVYGEKRIGKTSLLLQVRRRLAHRADMEPEGAPAVIFRNIQDLPQEQFWLYLMRGIAADTLQGAAESAGLLCLGQPAGYDDLDAEQDLERIAALAAARGRPLIVLLLDEIDTLERYSQPVRQRFRAFCQHAQTHLRVVLAGVRPPVADPGDTSPWYNIFERVALGPLSVTDALHLIRHYNGNPYRYTRAAEQAILLAGGRKPFDTQWLCSEAVRAMLSARRSVVTAEDVEQAMRLVLAARAAEYAAAWARLSPADQAALRAGDSLSPAACANLKADGLVALAPDGLRATALWARWIADN